MNTQMQQNEVAQIANDVRRNVPNYLEFGKKAVQDWKNGDGAIARGQQRAIYCCALAWDAETFIATIENKKTGAIEEQWSFDLQEYMHSEPKKADGTRDNKKSQAQHEAVFKTLFGIDEPTNNQKTRIKSCLQVVDYILNVKGFDVTDLVWNESKNTLEVPYVTLEDEPKPDADEEEKKRYQAMKSETVALTGKRGRAVADLERRAKPPSSRAPHGNGSGQGSQLLASVKFANTAIAAILDMSKDADKVNSPSPELREHLWALQNTLARYFEEDGLNKEEEAMFNKNKKLNTRASK